MPMPFTAPASPNAAPLRSAYPSPPMICASNDSTSARRSSSSSDCASKGRQSATDFCTASDGVDNTSTKRLRICLTRGSVFSRCEASDPRKTATPCRTLSACNSVRFPDEPPVLCCRSKYPSYTARSCWMCSAPCISITARPPRIAASLTGSSSSPSTFNRNVLTRGKSFAVNDPDDAPSARTIAHRPNGSPTSLAPSSSGKCTRPGTPPVDASEIAPALSGPGDAAEYAAKSLASAGATPPRIAAVVDANASTAASRADAALCLRNGKTASGDTRLDNVSSSSPRPIWAHNWSAATRVASSTSRRARKSLAAAEQAFASSDPDRTSCERASGALASAASAAARTDLNSDSRPSRSAEVTSVSSPAPAATSSSKGFAAAAVAPAPVAMAVSASLAAAARGRPSIPGLACVDSTSIAAFRIETGAMSSGNVSARAHSGNVNHSTAGGNGSRSFISIHSSTMSSAFSKASASATTRLVGTRTGSPLSSSSSAGALPSKQHADILSAVAILFPTSWNPKETEAFPGTFAAATNSASASFKQSVCGRIGEFKTGSKSVPTRTTSFAAAPFRVPPRSTLAVSARRKHRRSTMSNTFARTSASSANCATRASSALSGPPCPPRPPRPPLPPLPPGPP
mmetsp:Transcript_5972/g.22593  ORF Transcript_5972/g.22593 Transcript_5972/m.22593 type:complete len:631 (+) Transcript_5972:2289-4181(+)